MFEIYAKCSDDSGKRDYGTVASSKLCGRSRADDISTQEGLKMGLDKEEGAGLSRIEDPADRGSDLRMSRLPGEVRASSRRESIWYRGSTYQIHQRA